MTADDADRPPERAAQPAAGGDQIECLNNVDRQQYEIHLNGARVGLASYFERDGVTVIPHTETLPAFGGRGLAGRLVAYALDDIRSRGGKLDPACPFVADYVRKHPSYQDLLA
jgi:predicted GNAT family acetyltransferase